jgi:hypothetical protein
MVDPAVSVPLVGALEVVLGAGLLAATAALALHTRSPRPDATTAHRLPAAHDPAHSTPTQDAA